MPETAFLGAQIAPNRCLLGLRPKPYWGSLQRSPRPPSWIQGALLLRGGEGKGREGRGGPRKIVHPEKFLRIGPGSGADPGCWQSACRYDEL